MIFPPMRNYYSMNPSNHQRNLAFSNLSNLNSTNYAESVHNTYSKTDFSDNKKISEKKDVSNSSRFTQQQDSNSNINNKNSTKNFPFDVLDKILSNVEGDDLIILGVICLLYKSDDKDILLIIVLLMLLFDI